VLFGDDDGFINLFAGLIARLPALPVFGPNAQLQPLFVDDAAEAIANALCDPAQHGGKTYEIGGPEVLTMGDINRRIAAAQGRSRLLMEVPDFASRLFAKLTGWLPGAPLSSDQWAMLEAGNTAAGGTRDIAALGVTPRPLGLFMDRWMIRYRAHGRFGERAKA
jgi:NADH dehydrogenase